MTREEWIAEFARRLQITAPTEMEIEQLLDLASEAAHASERAAAPIACWMAARSQLTLADVLERSREIA